MDEKEKYNEEAKNDGSSPCSSGQDSPEIDRNPSPPPEGDNETVEEADAIGQTVYSKHWLFSTLTRLIQIMTQQDSGDEDGLELSDENEEDLCKVWDMAMDKDVASLLQDFKAADILLGVIAKSRNPRLTEICVGILGNMACFQDTRVSISQNAELGAVLLLLLGDSDPPTLLETCRLLLTCLSHPDVAPLWLERIRQQTATRNNLCFIMLSSTNVDLLLKVAELVDKLFDEDEELMKSWLSDPPSEIEENKDTQQDIVSSLLEAAVQIRRESPNALEVYLHALQLLTTVDEGVQKLVSDRGCGDAVWSMVCEVVCEDLCQPNDPPLILQEQKAILAPGLALLSVLYSSLQKDISSALVSSLLRILYFYSETQQALFDTEKDLAGGHGEENDVQLQVLAEVAAELLSSMLTDLPEHIASDLLNNSHLTEKIWVSALKKLLPQYITSVQCLIPRLSEVEPKLADVIERECSNISGPNRAGTS